MLEKMEKDDEKSSCNQNKPKKKKLKDSKQPDNFEEHWFNINEQINSNIHVLNTSVELNDQRSEVLNSVKSTLNLINDSMKTMSSVTPLFKELIQSMTDLLNYEHINKSLLFDIVKTLIGLSNKNLIKLELKSYLAVICFIMKNCCCNENNKNTAPFLKHLRKLLNVQNEELRNACLIEKNRILSSLRLMLEQIQFCVSDNGIEIISTIVAIDEEFVKEFQDRVKRILVSCKKNEALKLGKIYYRIWELMTEENQKSFEERYIQWLMERAFTIGRQEVPVRNLSINLQSLLSGLHQARKQIKFSRTITALYTPLIWKYLNSSNNIHRSNAAEIFMDVYPLEKLREGIKGYSKYLRKQHEEMLILLEDPCPIVRVIAIKGICTNMRYFWLTFQNGTSEKIIEKFVTELVVDGSYSDVRKAVYQGLTQLLCCEQSHNLLKGILPSLGGFIHDENQSVRQAFIAMLIKIKYLKCDIKYWHIVDIYNVALRMAEDSPKNRQLIVHLIFSSFFNDKIVPEDTFKRLCKFISVSPTATRYLAMYSQSELKFENAIGIMCTILTIMRHHVKSKMETPIDENKEPDEYVKPQKNLKINERVLTSVENISDSDKETIVLQNLSGRSLSSEDSDLNRSANIFDPRIAHGLFDFVSMLWLIHGKTLQAVQNKEHLEKLHNTVAKCIPFFLRFFKGTHAFFGALNLASMVPLSKIAHCTTVVGSSLSMLRQTTLDTPRNENHCLIHVLCLWNRVADVLELTTEWLDEAFRLEALNESYAIQEQTVRKKVRFPRSEAKPIIALQVLDDLFSSPTDQKYVFSKNTADLKNLLHYLSRIKILIDRRIDKGSEINELLSDNFLINCFTIYGNLIIMFNENKVEGFNFWKKFNKYLEWCERTFVKSCKNVTNESKQSTDSIIFDLMQITLTQCLNLVAIGKCNDSQLMSLMEYFKSFLDSEHGIYFVEISLHFLKQIGLFSRVHHINKRETDIMVTMFPTIMDIILTLLTDKIYSKDILIKFIKDLSNFRRNLIYIYILLLKLYPKLTQSGPSYRILRSHCQSLINIVLFPITECETLNVDQNVKNLPFVGGFLAAVFMSQIDLSSALLFVLKTIIERFTEKDGLILLAVASLLYTFAFSDGKIPKSEILKIVKITYNKLQCISTEGELAVVMDHERTVGDRTIIDVEETTESALKEIGQHILRKIAEQLGGSLS